jgi:ribosomal protein S27E
MTVYFSVHLSVWEDISSIFHFQSSTQKMVPKNPLDKFNARIQDINKRIKQGQEPITFKSFPFFRNLCKECLNQEIIIIHKDGILVCMKCGFILKNNLLEDEHSNEYRHHLPSKQKRHYTVDYQKRRNHFKFWLHRLQGKEQNKLKKEDIDFIKSFIKDRSLQHLEWDYQTMKKILKMMHKEEWYNHIYYILKVACHQPLVEFTSYHEDILLDMFLTIQSPFSEYRDKRVNMLNYAYLLRKFTEIQGWTFLSDQIPYIKSHVKLYSLDCIWKKICNRVGFPFIKSIH